MRTFYSRYKQRHPFIIKAISFAAGRKERELPESYGTLAWAISQGHGRAQTMQQRIAS